MAPTDPCRADTTAAPPRGLRAAACACAIVLGCGASAQDKGPAPEARTADARTSVDRHSERTSRELFGGCDADGDDRLDLFEANDALETLDDPRDSSSFLRLDADRDGYLSWPEFDRHFRTVVERGVVFRVRTCRQQVANAPEHRVPRAATPVQTFLQLHDKNRNGGLDPEELDHIVVQAGLPPAIGGQLKSLDVDRSGRLEERELAPWIDQPWFQQLGGRAVSPSAGNAVPSPLPPPWQGIDQDGDARIDLGELTAALRRLDPSLVRWAKDLLRQLDRNGDGAANGDELAPAGSNQAPSTPPDRTATKT